MTRNQKIKLSSPQIKWREFLFTFLSLRKNEIAQGRYIEKFEQELARLCCRKYAVALSSGTSALHIALLALKINEKSKVIVPTLTFAATAFAANYVKANVVFIDCGPDSLNLDLDLLDNYLSVHSHEITAIIIVDLFGIPCDYRKLHEITSKYSITMIQDAAEALGSESYGIKSGGFGEVSILSFNGNKLITTGGGGALLTDDFEISLYARKISSQAREPVLWYEHKELGYNYRISNISAAIGYAQIKTIKNKIRKKQKIHNWYKKYLDGELVKLFHTPENSKSNYWLNIITINDSRSNNLNLKLIENLSNYSIEARPIWKPLHQQTLYKNNETILSNNANNFFANSLCLPSDLSMTQRQIKRISNIINEFLK
jgi:dTDP-4-amino-4,6-dideoxygalactose transaminase